MEKAKDSLTKLADLFTDKDLEEQMKDVQSNYDHVEKFEVTIALVGTMKAGKSTVINSFVGKELSPHRTDSGPYNFYS